MISKNDNLHIVQPENNFNKTLLICFKLTVALLVSHRLNTSNFLKLIWKVVIPIRGRIGNVDNELSNKFNLENQLHSVPIPLLELIRLLVDGVRVDNMKYSPATLSISLLTVSNFHKKINKNNLKKHWRNILCRETPLMLFNVLRMYASTKSRTLVDCYFQMGLCVSYDHVLHVTKGISDNLVRKFKTHGIFAPGELKSDVFTMVAKDNLDHNAMSSTATKHFHGANMTVMQTPTPGKTGTNISNLTYWFFCIPSEKKNFHLYVLSIKKLIKWYFTLDHYHYARWVSVHLYDLIHLHINCPDVSVAFVSGMFCFDKTTRPFSSMAPDQLHEQNNRVIKMFGGATAFLNREDQPGLERWGLCSSELASIIAD